MGAEDKGLDGTDPKEDPKGQENPAGEGQQQDPKPKADPKGDDGNGEGVKDSHGQPGINKERHDKEVEKLNAEIAKLKAEAKDAAENKAKREEYEKKVSDLEAKMADSETTHRLELAGCRSVKAAKALLDDFGGDVSKLKAEHPYLFEAEKQTGRAGGKPGGAPNGIDDKIDAMMGVK